MFAATAESVLQCIVKAALQLLLYWWLAGTLHDWKGPEFWHSLRFMQTGWKIAIYLNVSWLPHHTACWVILKATVVTGHVCCVRVR